MSFSELLKNANTVQNKSLAMSEPQMISDASIMTLSLDEPMVNTFAAYSGEDDEWTLSKKYDSTEDKSKGRHYEDENYSTVDEARVVKVDSSQINLTQESNSQYIPFLMPRYFDGIDLMNMTLRIYYINANGAEGWADPINVYYNSTQIRFGWLLTELETALKGKLTFEIQARGTNPLGNRYLFKTRPNSQLDVLESLQGNGEIIYDKTWSKTFLDTVEEYKEIAENSSKEAAEYLDEIVTIVTNAESDLTGYSKREINELLDQKASVSKVEEIEDTVEQNSTDISTLIEYIGEIPEGIESNNLIEYIHTILLQYYTEEEVNGLLSNIESDITQLETSFGELENDFNNFDGLAKLTVEYHKDTSTLVFLNDGKKMQEVILDVNTDEDIANALKPIQDDLDNIHETIDDLPETLATDYYTKNAVDNLLVPIKNDIGTNKSSIESLITSVSELDTIVDSIDKSPRTTYDVAYNDKDDPEVGENKFVFYEITNAGQENEQKTIKKKFTITGGSGGSASSSLVINYVTTSPVIATKNDKVLITYKFTGTDSAGDPISQCNYTWKIGSRVIATGVIYSGENTFDATKYATTTNQTFTLILTDEAGNVSSKSWAVQKVDVYIDGEFFNDTTTYPTTEEIPFTYKAYGAIKKDIHFVLDGEEIGTVTTNTSGVLATYKIPPQTHGAHLLDVYITTTINNVPLESEHVYKSLVWEDSENKTPIVGCANTNIKITQYDSVEIKYTVFDKSTETPKVTWYVDDKVLSEETLTKKDEKGYYTFLYKANNHGVFTLKVVCGDSEPAIITVTVEQLSINVSPVLGGLEFDFNPVDYSNSSKDRLWSHNNVTMTVSDNFDWINGGYQTDENGDKYFCVKAGTTAVINYNLFANDPKEKGKEFKVIFRTKNIRKRDTSFLTCMDNNIGLDMKVEDATIYNTGNSLKTNYCEDTIIEYEFNINKQSDMMIVMTYEDGTPSKPCEYTGSSSFNQSSPKPITIGSADCDVHIYRIKAYSNSLTDIDIQNNFIADARNSSEMIARYNRNQIYNDGALVVTDDEGGFNIDALMKAAPDLRYIFLEVPRFTYDKDDKVDDCTVYFRYPNGTRPEDNWTCTGMRHRGQGTSSNSYGYSGRNIDLVMDRSTSLFTWIDEEGNTVESSTITLTDTSFPTDYLNIKVNIASSENTNNAQMARRFNEFQPFLRYARKKDSRIKDTMEFYNCVLFIREYGEDETKYPHQEFNDTNWHFYAIGNVGDSKKTDDTRVNNANDPKEHVVEIMDADKPLCGFPTGKENNEICPVSQWKSGNSAYDILYSTEYVYDDEGEFESFGGTSFEFRYEMDDITEEQRETNINAWRNLYKFIVTSSDSEFYEHLKDYFVVDSALYYYLFTERYTMVDNRAKNSFWHYGKVYISNAEAIELGETEASYYIIDDEAAAINDGYRYDLTFGYDFDTCLGIDNTGDYVFPYGKEDTDYYVDGDPSSEYVFRVADSTFFCRLRDLFPAELKVMYRDREGKNTWSADSLIKQWDNEQIKFPEELWRLDYERKYYRTYLGISIDNSIAKDKATTFLIGKFFGRKKYARRHFESNQEIYFATKYFGKRIEDDQINFRGSAPSGSTIKQNYSLTLVPYLDMYVCVKYTSTGTPIHQKVKAGQTCYFENNSETMDFIYIYAAGYIQEIGDLSRCYIKDNDFSKATRLQKLVIGSTEEGYENTFMSNITTNNLPLLEYLDIRNISGLNSSLDLSGCGNLKELYAEGTNITGVTFANGGLLETAHLPSIGSLTMKNLNYIKDFSVDSYSKLHTLVVENVPNFNTYEIVKKENSPVLRFVRLIGINWDKTYQIENTDIFDRLLTLGGKNSADIEIDLSVLTGTANVGLIGEQDQIIYKEAWSELDIIPEDVEPQYTVEFRNHDGKLLNVQYIRQFGNAIDPMLKEIDPIPTPTKEKTIQYEYIFTGWDKELTNITSDRVITATFSPVLRRYTAHYVVNGNIVYQKEGNYGDNIIYEGKLPSYISGEPAVFRLFKRWNKSGLLTSDFNEHDVKIIEAEFDEFTYSENCFDNLDLSNMRPVQIYALTKLSKIINEETGQPVVKISDVIADFDEFSFKIGHDFTYDDIRSEIIVDENNPKTFDGTSYYDTEIKLFDEDKDFVLAIDYEFASSNDDGKVLIECYDSFNEGFKISYGMVTGVSGNKVKIDVGEQNTKALTSLNKREMLIIRHVKGEHKLHIYNSNLDELEIAYHDMSTGTENVFISNSTLVFGAHKVNNTTYNYRGIGNINWCKIWYGDLGDDTCRKLALWFHEDITLNVCGVDDCSIGRHYISNTQRQEISNMTLIASHLLTRNKPYNNENINSGGWAQSDLNKYLNQRLYNALPVQIQLLTKQVEITSTIGDKSSETSTSDCYITIPALVDVDTTQNKAPYNVEAALSDPVSISYMTTNDTRKRAYLLNDQYGDYWLRSPNLTNTTSTSRYVWYVTNTGETKGTNRDPNVPLGVLIEISF